MLKILVFLLVIPYFTFATQENIDRLHKKIFITLKEIRILAEDKKQYTVHYAFLTGKLEAYYEEIGYEIECQLKKK